MKRVLVVAAVLLAGCGSSGSTAVAPSPTAQSRSGILAPAERAQTTVDQLNDQTKQREQQTSNYP